MKNLTFYTTNHVMTVDTIADGRKTVTTIKHRWRLRANNGRIIGASTQGYRRRIDCVNNSEMVMEYLASEMMARMLGESTSATI